MENIVYKAVVSAHNKPDKKDFCIAETSFKDRFKNNTETFATKSMLTAPNFLNTCGNLKLINLFTAKIKWNIM